MNVAEFGDGAEDAALHLDHLDRRQMVADVGRRAAVGDKQALVAQIVGVAHGGVHADVGGDAGQHDVADTGSLQHQLQVGGHERALAGLVDDHFARLRLELGDDLPAGLAAHQDAAARPLVADAGADPLRAPALVGRQVGEVGLVALARVDDAVALGAHGGKHPPDGFDRRPRQRDVVAHGIDVAAGRAEIDLHVDDDQRRVGAREVAVEGPGIGIGLDRARARHHRRGDPFVHRLAGAHVRAPHLVIDSSDGAPRSARLGEVETIMMMRVST